MTKAKGYILIKKGQRQKQKALPFLHKGIINNNSFTLELVTSIKYTNLIIIIIIKIS